MDAILSVLKWFKGGTISVTIAGIEIKVAIGLDGKTTISASGETEAVVDFVKGIIKK